MNQLIAGGTRVNDPDLDWSQVRETVLMLELAAGQVEAAMKDSNNSVDVLAVTFTELADTLSHIQAAVDTLPDTIGNGLVKAEIQANTRFVNTKVHQAIVAFQFYDKLVQRLDHVCLGLAELSGLVSDKKRLFNPEEWRTLQDAILSKYTMTEERMMFEAVLNGTTVRQALNDYVTVMKDKAGSDKVELF